VTSQLSLLPDASPGRAGLQYRPEFISEQDDTTSCDISGACLCSPSNSARSRAKGAWPRLAVRVPSRRLPHTSPILGNGGNIPSTCVRYR
jgi:hypothetical protein